MGEAWRICRDEVLSGNIGGLVLFYVLRFVLAIGVAIAVFVLSCVTCCISRIPYLGTVLVLPIFVFWRAYSLYYMEQLGPTNLPRPGTVMGRVRPMAVSEVRAQAERDSVSSQ